MHRIERDVAATSADVMHQLNERPVPMNVPEEVRQENQKSDGAGDPDPFVGEGLTFRCEQQSDDNTQPEHGYRIFVLQADARQHAEPQPQLLVAGLDNADDDGGATHPEEGLEVVGAEQVAVDDEHRRNRNRQSPKSHRKASSAELVRLVSGEGDSTAAGDRRDHADHEQRGTEQWVAARSPPE